MVDLEHNIITRDKDQIEPENIDSNKNINKKGSRKLNIKNCLKIIFTAAAVTTGALFVNENSTARVSHKGDSISDYHYQNEIDRRGKELTLENMIGDYYYHNNGRASKGANALFTKKITDDEMLNLLNNQSKLRAYFLDNGDVYKTNPLYESLNPFELLEKSSYTSDDETINLSQANEDADEFMAEYGLTDASISKEKNNIVIKTKTLSK